MRVSGTAKPKFVRSLAVSLAAALGAAFGGLSYSAVMESLANPSGWLQFLVVAPLMFLASRSFLDPLSAQFRRAIGIPVATPSSGPSGRWLWALATGSFVMLIWLGDALQKLAEAKPLITILTIAVAVAYIGSTTFAWIRGATSAWPLAWLYGGVTAGVVNGGLTYLILDHYVPTAAPEMLVNASIMTGLSSAIVGMAGGSVLDARIGRRPSIAAPLAAIVAFAATGVIGAAMGSITLDQALPNIALGLGWLVGLANAPGADDALRRNA